MARYGTFCGVFDFAYNDKSLRSKAEFATYFFK